MSKSLKSCGELSPSQIKILAHVSTQLVEIQGKRDIHEILDWFYSTISFREPQSRALLAGYLPVFLVTGAVSHTNANAKSITQEDFNSLQKLITEANSLAREFSLADNIFEYIDREIIGKKVDDIVEDDPESEPDPVDPLENPDRETQQMDPEKEARLKNGIQDDEVSRDAEPEQEYDYKVGEELVVTQALIHRKGITMHHRGQTLRANHRYVKGQHFAEVLSDGLPTETLPMTEFSEKYKDWYFTPDEVSEDVKAEVEQSKRNSFQKTLDWIRQKFTVVYGNAMDAVQAGKNFFSMDKGKLVPGELADAFKMKNTYFGNLMRAGSGATLLDGISPSLQPSAAFHVEISDYPHTLKIQDRNTPYLNITVEYTDGKGKKQRVIVANISPPTDKSELVKNHIGTPEVQAYRENYLNLVKGLQGSKKIKIAGNTPVSRVFLPVLDSDNQNNLIYDNETDRVKSDQDKAHKLSLTNGISLMQSMGFTVSPIMVDVHNKNESAMAGQAFVAVSPFHSDLELRELLKDNKEWAEAGGLHPLAMKHNINIIYLNRKELSFDDYERALAGHLNPGRYTKDGTDYTDSKKISAMFNPSQSFYMLRRIASAMEAVEKKVESTKGAAKAKLQEEFEKMVVYFFNNLHSHGIPLDRTDASVSPDINTLNNNLQISADLSDLKEGKPVSVLLLNQSMENWKRYKEAAPAVQSDLIKAIAIRRFGWFNRDQDTFSRNVRETKVESGKIMRIMRTGSNETFSDSAYLSEGGMTGSEIVRFFDFLRANPSLQTAAKASFDSASIRNTETKFATYNPVVQGKKMPMQRIMEAAPISQGPNAKGETMDLNYDFLEIDRIPMMPHVVVSMDSIMGSAGISHASKPANPGSDPTIAILAKASSFGKRRGPGNRNRLSSRQFIQDNSIDRENSLLTEEEAIALTENLVGDLAQELSFGKVPLKLKDSIAIGSAARGLIFIHSQDGKLSEKVLRHEIFHKVLNELLDRESYERIIQEGHEMMAKEYGEKSFTRTEVEEYLAERYEASYGSYQNKFTSKLPAWIRTLFQGLKTLYRRLTGNYSQYVATLERLEDGGFRFSPARFDHYNGDARYKEFSTSILSLSEKLGWGDSIEEIQINGREEFDHQLTVIRANMLETMFQNEALFVQNNRKNLNIHQAADLAKAIMEHYVREDGASYFPELSNPTLEDIYSAFAAIPANRLNEDPNLLEARNYARAVQHFDELKEYAFDFYDFTKIQEDGFDVELDPETLASLDEDAQTDAKIHQLADRGALSGIKTMNRKVKFHLTATLIPGTLKPVSAEKASAILTEVVNKTKRKNGAFDVSGFLAGFKSRLDNLSLSPNSFEYKTMKAIWDKYFNPMPSTQEGVSDSYLSIANKTSEDPNLRAYYKRHMDVVVALISAYSTVKITEFVKPINSRDGVSLRPTSSDRSAELKNEANSNFIHNNFSPTVEGDEAYYMMKAETISRLFKPNDAFGLSFEKDTVTIQINGKQAVIPKSEIKSQASGYTDISRAFVRKLYTDKGFSHMDLQPLLRAMGFNVPQETALEYLRKKSDETDSALQTRRVEWAQEILTGYLVMAMEMVHQSDLNPNADPEMMPGYSEFGGKEILERIGKNRTDQVDSITRKSEQGKSEQLVARDIYTPTKSSEFFRKVSEAQALSRIGSASSFETIAGSKHTKDKLNTPLMERINNLKDMPLDVEREARAVEMQNEKREFAATRYPALASGFYQNKFLSGSQRMTDFYQLQTIESRENNTSKEFLDFNSTEFLRVLLGGALSGDESQGNRFDADTYWHPLEIQADRGYLPLVKLQKLFTSGYNENGLDFSPELRSELQEVYNHRFVAARTALMEVAKTPTGARLHVQYQGEKMSLGEAMSDWSMSPSDIASIFDEVNAAVDKLFKLDPSLSLNLAENAVWQKHNGEFVLNQLLYAQLNQSEQEFFAGEKRKFIRFAQKVLTQFSTGNNLLKTDLKDSKKYGEANKHFLSVYEDEEGERVSKYPQLFKFQQIKALQKELIEVDLLQMAHPALWDMFFNYRVNNLHARQVLFGELHAFSPEKGMAHLEAGYIADYSKRITGAGTSKINFVFNETVQVDGETVDADGNPVNTKIAMNIAPDGLNRNIPVLNLTNLRYSFAENPQYMQDVMANRTNIGELRSELTALTEPFQEDLTNAPAETLGRISELEDEIRTIESDFSSRDFAVDDGTIFATNLFMSLARNSMGNTEGFPMKAIMKLTLNNVHLSNGQVDYDKALNMVLTPEYMDEVGPEQEMYLAAMYSRGVIQTEAGERTLWDVYNERLAGTGSRKLAEQAVLKAYLDARKAGGIISEPAMYANTTSSTKGTKRKINPNPIEAVLAGQDPASYLSGLAFDHRNLSDGFGAVLDLTSDITGKDIALSSQMLYLLGIVGDKNHHSVQMTYKALEKLSHFNARDIEREVQKMKEKYGITDEADMVRSWALDMIRKSYEKQGDFGSGYRLSEDPNSQSVSHPLHKNKMFGAIASQINKGVAVRVKGFKGIQLPATGLLHLYDVVSEGAVVGTMTLSGAKKTFGGNFEGMLASGQISKRNLRYSAVGENGISQTEIITGNFFSKQFGTGNATLQEIFTLRTKDEGSLGLNIEADNYQILTDESASKSGKSYNVYKANLHQTLKELFGQINWEGNFALKNAIAKSEKNLDRLKKKQSRLEVTNDEREVQRLEDLKNQIDSESKLLGSLDMIRQGIQAEGQAVSLALKAVTDQYYEMNKALYGVMTRIPSTGKNSSTVFRVRAFVDSHENGMFVPAEWLEITGSDHDGDSAMMWQFGSGQQVAEDMLHSTIQIMSDPDNAQEIFSDIDTDMQYVKDFAKRKKSEAQKNGLGYNIDDLYTFDEVRGNNGVGATMTGSSALASKTYSNSYIAKMQYLSLGGDMSRFQAPDVEIFGENPSARGLEKNTGMIPEKTISGKFVYKWLETITNSAIDNPKHLVMGALNIKRYNSDLHSAMVMLGYSKETIAEFFNHPTVVEVFKKAESYDDPGASFYSVTPLQSAINAMLNDDGVSGVDSFTKTDFETSMAIAMGSNGSERTADQILHLVNALNYYAGDFRDLQNVSKVNDQVKGMPTEQRAQFRRIMKALDFKTYTEVMQFVSDYRKTIRDKKSVLDMNQLQAPGSNRLLNPRVLVALNPSLMASLKSHMDFVEKTKYHLLYSETVLKLRAKMEKMIPRNVLSRPMFAGKIDQAFYHQFAGLYLQNGKKPFVTTIDKRKYDLSAMEGRVAFVEAFNRQLAALKREPKYRDNAFLDELTVDGNLLEIKMSHNFDTAQENIMLNAFRKLENDLRDQIFHYLLATEGISFKRHGIVKFISPEAQRGFNAFLKGIEQDPDSIWEGENVDAFIHSFFVANKEMAPEFRLGDLSEDQIGLAYNRGGKSYREARYSSLKSREVNDRKTIPANPEMSPLADQKFKFNEKGKAQSKEISGEIKKLKSSLKGKEETLRKNLALLFDENVIEDKEKIDSIEAALIENQEQVILEENPEWTSKESRAAAYINGFFENTDGQRRSLLDLMKAQEEVDNTYFEDAVDSMIENGDIPVKNRSPYRLVKVWENGKVINTLYKLSMGRDSSEKPTIEWQKVKTFNSMIDTPVNLFRPGKIIPTIAQNQVMKSIDLNQYQLLKDGKGAELAILDDLKGHYTNFVTKVNEDGSMESFQLNDGLSKAESVQKIKSIVRVIQKAFPNIQIKMVKGQKGIYAQAKGWVSNGVIHLNLDNATADTGLHEAGHILIDLIEQTNPEFFAKLSSIARTHPMLAEIEARYQKVGNSEADNTKEVLVTLLGMSQADLLSSVSEGTESYVERVMGGFWEQAKAAFSKMLELFGLKTDSYYDKLLKGLEEKKDLQSVFDLIGRAVVEGKVLTDISSRQYESLLAKHGKSEEPKFSKAEIRQKIKSLIDQGLVTRTCK